MSSLYLHIPFCRSKCPYCDFYSQVGTPQLLEEYVVLLGRQLQFLPHNNSEIKKLKTIFFGGGTPSLLSGSQVGQLLQQIEDSFTFSADIEITLEANPGTLDPAKLDGYRCAGVNRLSLGVQSLCEQRLQALGRSHSVAEARSAVRMARDAGFDNLSLDLMFALPGQRTSELEVELGDLLALQPEHLSVYGLSFEPDTEFAARKSSGELREADEQLYEQQYRLLHRLLTVAGFEHYEISNFARKGFRCRHNQVYWQRSDCLALGCGAHGFSLRRGWGERTYVPEDLDGYRGKLAAGEDPTETLERFERRSAMAETVYLALRTADGLSRRRFREMFGCDPEEAFPRAFVQRKEHLQRVDDHWRFGLDAWLLYDHLIGAFLS